MEWISLPGNATRAAALEAIIGPSKSVEDDSELCIYATGVIAVDAVTGAALRMRVAQHLREHPKGRVTIVAPRLHQAAERLYDLLWPVPGEVTIVGLPDDPKLGAYAVIPATVVPSADELPLLGELALQVCVGTYRVARRRARFVSAAVMELVDNAFVHGADALDTPVVAVSCIGRERTVEVVVIDSGGSVSEAEDPVALVRGIPGKAIEGSRGFLAQILRRGALADVQVRVEVFAGVARLRWNEQMHRTDRERHVPGTTVVLRVGE